MSLTPIDRWHGMPAYFNTRAADAVYGAIVKMDDDSAEVLADLLVGAAYQYDLTRNDHVINKALDDYLDENGDALRDALLRSYVSKRENGEPVDGLLAAAEIVSKDFTGPAFTPQARAERARHEHRDLVTGRFVQSHHQIGYSHDVHGRDTHPLSDREAKVMGIPMPAETRGLNAADRAAYQQAYLQVAALTQGYRRHPEGAFLHLHYPTGEEIHEMPAHGEELPLSPRRRLTAVSVSKIPRFQDMDSYDALGAAGGALGHQYQLGANEEGVNAGVQRIRDLNRNLATNADAFDRTGSRVMRRVGAGSQFLDQSFTDKDGNSVLPRKMQAALKAGQVVGLYGPEAQNVIGPAADRAAYRYRGTERAPDRRLTTALESLRRNPNLKTAEDRREIAVHGLETDNGWRPSGVLNYFRSQLPDANLNTLQRKSGTIPPSQGVIFDKNGKMTTQAVGYGDDHYLPFNLRKLKDLRGGEYIRTRSWGGPTTEDVYTGLISGAKSISVVSHNGVYNIEFDPSFKGSRRYNDKAARMVSRYGQLLDAVKNGQITTGQLDPARRAEIEDQAAASYDPDLEPNDYRLEVDRLMARERRNPTLSAAQRAQTAQEFLDNEALKHRTPDGHEMTRAEFVDDWLNRQTAEEFAHEKGNARPGQPVPTPMQIKSEIARTHGLDVNDPGSVNENAIRAMGLGEKYSRYQERAEHTYRESLKPLELNGPGYDMALHALQEQFPYYISSVEFHPWSDAKNGRDTGYVKPKHNRPAGVLTGYFDPTINGHSKVTADSIRGQGTHKEPNVYRTTAQRAMDAAKEKAEGAAGSLTGGRVGAGQLSASTARELRNRADRDMLSELRRQTHFGPEITAAGRSELAGIEAGKGRPWRDHEQDLRKINGDLADVIGMTDAEIDREQSTPEGADRLHRKLAAAMDANEKHKVFDVKPEAARAFRADGKPEGARKYNREETAANLRSDSDFDFAGRVYQKGAVLDPAAVKTAFDGDGHIKTLRPLGLSASVDSPDFDDQMRQVHTVLAQRQRAKENWELNGGWAQNKPAGVNELPRLVEGYNRAQQLRRRYTEAEAAQREEAEADQGGQPMGFQLPGGGNLQVVVHQGAGPQAAAPGNAHVDSEFNGMMLRNFGTT